MDVDYNVVKNSVTEARHLVIQPEGSKFADLSTICGIKLRGSNIFWDTKESRKFWRSKRRCRNCIRAAKH